MPLTRFFIIGFESRTTARSQTASSGSMLTLPTRNGSLFVFANIWDEPSHMYLVFSAFSWSWFVNIHILTPLMQRRSTAAEVEESAAEQLVCIVSVWMMVYTMLGSNPLNVGCMHYEEERPRIKPYGTQCRSGMNSKISFWKDRAWVQSLRKNWKHSSTDSPMPNDTSRHQLLDIN